VSERLPAAALAAVGEAFVSVLAERHPEVRWTLLSVDEPDCSPSETLSSEEMNDGGRSE
jgi:hypothetical protein